MTDRVLDATGRAPNSHRGEVAKLVNAVYIGVVERSRLNTRTATVELVPDQADYVLSTDLGLDGVVAIRSLTYTLNGDTGAVPLFPVTHDTIYGYRAAQSVSSGTASAYAFWGEDTLALWPTPTTIDTLTLTYDFRPDLMTLDDDEPDALPAEYHYVVEDGAISRSARYKPALAQLAAAAEARYQAGLADLVRYRNRRGGAMPVKVTVGRRRGQWRRGNDISYTGDA